MDGNLVNLKTNAGGEKKGEIIALLSANVPVREIVKQTGVSQATIYIVKRKWEEHLYHGAVKDIAANLGGYIAQSLKNHLDALDRIAKVANEEEYIRSQSGRELAELHKQLEHWTTTILSASNTLSTIEQYHQEALSITSKTKK